MATFALKDLHNVCDELNAIYQKNIVAAPKNDKWKAGAIETIRKLAEVVLYGEAHSDQFFELFAEKAMMGLLVAFATSAHPDLAIQIQVIQTVSILIQNVRRETSLYLVLSSNYVNTLLQHHWGYLGEGEEWEQGRQEREELEANFVSLLKTLSLRLNPSTVHFFIDEAGQRFSLFDVATGFVTMDKEPMTRTAALSTVLNIYRVENAHVRRYVARGARARRFVRAFCALVATLIRDAVDAAVDAICTVDRVDPVLTLVADLFYYAQDVLDGPALFERLWVHDLSALFKASVLDRLAPAPADPTTAQAASAAGCWYVASLFFRAITNARFCRAAVALVYERADALLGAVTGADEAAATCAVLALDAVLTSSAQWTKKTTAEGAAAADGTSRGLSLLEQLTMADKKTAKTGLFDDEDDEDEEEDHEEEDVADVLADDEVRRRWTRRAAGRLAEALDPPSPFGGARCVGFSRLVADALGAVLAADPSCRDVIDGPARRALGRAAAQLLAKSPPPSSENHEDETAIRDDYDDEASSFFTSSPKGRRRVATTLAGRAFAVLRHRPSTADLDFAPAPPSRAAEVRLFLALSDLARAPPLAPRDDDPSSPEAAAAAAASLDLLGRTCVPCSTTRAAAASSNDLLRPGEQKQPPNKAWVDLFLVIDPVHLLLVIPDPSHLARGQVLSEAPLHQTRATVDPKNCTKLDLEVRSATPQGLMRRVVRRGRGGAPEGAAALWTLSLIFESERNCRVACTKLTDRRNAERRRRADDLRAHLAHFAHFAPPAT